MSNLSEDFEVITIRREDIAYIIFRGRDEMDLDNALAKAELLSSEVMQMIATRMGELYFEDELYVDFRWWVITAWDELDLDKLNLPLDTTGSA
jgi:hypothetical protein